jgi:nitroreductase
MDLTEAIFTTRAVRRFTDEPVSTDDVLACLRAANQGPSGGNIQPWQWLVVRDPAVRSQVAEVYLRSYDRYEPALLAGLPPFRSEEDEAAFHRSVRASRHLAEHLAEVPVLIAVCMPAISMSLQDEAGELDVGTPYASVYPAVQNLLLAARDRGLGTTLTTVYRVHQDDLRAVLGVPARYEIVALVPMGHPKGAFSTPRRRRVESVTRWDHWENRTPPDAPS